MKFHSSNLPSGGLAHLPGPPAPWNRLQSGHIDLGFLDDEPPELHGLRLAEPWDAVSPLPVGKGQVDRLLYLVGTVPVYDG